MTSEYDKRIRRVLRYIHDNPAGDLSLDNLADIAAMSRFHFHRIFRTITGETCAFTVRRIRLFKAARWLLHKPWRVDEVAARVGYPNVKSFSRAFATHYGISPGAFCKNGCKPPRIDIKLKGKYRMFEVEIREFEGQRLAALHHTGPYTQIGPVFQKLGGYAASPDLQPHIRGVVGVYFDDPDVVAEKDLKSCAGFVVDEALNIPDGLEEVCLGSGRHAVLTYKGPYEDIKVAYDYLFGRWLSESDQQPAEAPCYEVYLNDPRVTKPEDLLTEIRLPLG